MTEVRAGDKVYYKPEPKLWDIRLAIVVAAMGLMVVGLLIREGRAFGLVAGLTTEKATEGTLLSYIEAACMALSVAASVVMSLFYWNGKTLASWEFMALLVGSCIEGFNSFLSATMNTGNVTYLISREFTVAILSFGAVVVWIVMGKVFSNAYHGYKQAHDEWYTGAMQWRNRQLERQSKVSERVSQSARKVAVPVSQDLNAGERRSQLFEMWSQDGEMSFTDLAKHFNVSHTTIGNDFKALERTGKVKRQDNRWVAATNGSGAEG